MNFFRFLGQNVKYMTDIGMAVSSIILMLELSVYMQNSSAFDALCNVPTPRVKFSLISLYQVHAMLFESEKVKYFPNKCFLEMFLFSSNSFLGL